MAAFKILLPLLATIAADAVTLYVPVEYMALQDAGPNITRWIESTVPSGSVVDFGGNLFPGNTFVAVSNRQNLVIQNGGLQRTKKGAIVWPRSNPHLSFNNCTDVAVLNFTVLGTNNVSDVPAPGFSSYNESYAFEAAILCGDSTGLTIRDYRVDAVWGDGLQVEGCHDIVLQDAVIEKNGRQGVSMSHGSNLLVHNVTVGHSRRAGVDIEPNVQSDIVSNVTLSNMTIGSWLLAVTSGGPGTVANVTLVDVHVWRSALPLLNAAPSGAQGVRVGWNITRLTVAFESDTTGGPLKFAQARDMTIAQSTVPIVTSRGRTAVELVDCGGVFTIVDNNFLPGGNTTYTSANPQPDLQVVASGNVPSA